MAVTINAKGTSVDSFVIGKAGPTITRSGSDLSVGSAKLTAAQFIGPATKLTVADTSDATTFPVLVGAATGDELTLTDGGLTYNASTAALSTTTFVGALTGNADTATTAAAWTTTRTINMTGDVSSNAVNIDGSGNVTITSTLIAADAVTYSKMQNVVADDRILGNISGAGGIVAELTAANVRTMINVENNSTADQTSIVGISGTKAQFDTAVTDGNIAYVGGAHHDGFSDFVAQEHIRWDLTGAGTIHIDNYIENATHTGQVEGSGALSLHITAITAQPNSGAIVAADTILINDGGTLSEATFTQMDTYFNSSLSFGTPTVITVEDSSDTTSFPAFFNSATGNLGPKTDASNYTYNATTGALTAASFVGSLSGNASTATTAAAWTTTRTITMTGDVGADAVNIDGSGNITITNTVVANDSHTHDVDNLTGLSAISSDFIFSQSSTALEIQVDIINTNDAGGTELRVRGNGQGDGYIFVGQSVSHGGGIAYRGDGTSPKAMTGAGTDRITYWRRDASVDHEVFSYAYSSNTVRFLGNVDFSSGIDVTGNITVTGTVDGIDIATDVAANTAKTTNATHGGQVTGSGTLTVVVAAIEGQTDIGANLVATDEILVSDAGNIRRADISRFNNYFNSALNFNNYSHPGHPGDDFSVDSGALSGATVISDIDINVTTDAEGHVTDANGVIATRNLTAANIGASATGHTHTGSTISALDAGDTTTGVFSVNRLSGSQEGATAKKSIIQFNRWGSNQEMAGSTHWDSGIYGGFSTMTNGPSGMTYDPFLIMGSGSDVRSFLVVPRTAGRPISYKGSSSSGASHTAWHYTGWTTTVGDADLSVYSKTGHTHTGSTISDLAAADTTSGTFAAARISTHTGDVTGQTALTLKVVAITGKTALTTGLAGTDELLVSDAGTIKRMDISVMNDYFDANLSFNNYTHPSHPGDDFSVDSGALSGATVISDIDINVTTDGEGHVTDANGVIATRNLTAANIGASATGHTHTGSTISTLDTGDTTTGTFADARISANSVSQHAGAGNLLSKAATEAITGTWTLDGAVTTADFGTGGRVKDGLDNSQPIGFNTIPVYEIDANDAFDLAHVGMLWHKDANAGVAFTCNIDNNIPQGASYLVHNDDTEDLTIIEGTATIEFLAPGAAPVGGTVTVEQGGIVTVYKYSDSIFWVWGAKAAATASNITVADESSDTSCFPIFTTAATGDLPAKSGTNLTFNSNSGLLTATLLAGAGSAITALNMGNAGSGTLAVARGGTGVTSSTGTGNVVLSASPTFSGTIDLDGTAIRNSANENIITWTANAQIGLYYNNTLALQTQNWTAADDLSSVQILNEAGNMRDAGFAIMEEIAITTAKTIAPIDAHKTVRVTTNTNAIEFTSDVNIAVGAVGWILNTSSGSISLTATTNIAWMDGTGTTKTGTRTLAVAGWVTWWKQADAQYYITGIGIT